MALNDRLLKLETQVQTDKAQLKNSQVQLSEAKSKNRYFTDQAIVFGALSATMDLAIRTRLRQAIRRKVARIDFWFSGRSPMTIMISHQNGERKFLV